MQWCHQWHYWSDAVPVQVPMVSHDQKAILHWWCLGHHVMLAQKASHDQKSHVASQVDCLDLMNVMMSLMIPLVSCDTNATASDTTWSKCHLAPHFEHLDQRNIVVPLMMPSVSCDADTDANDATWPKSHVVPHFDHLDLRNVMLPLMMLSVSCDASANGFTWSDKSCCTSFWLSWPKECNNNTVGIMWCWCQHQWCHMTKKNQCYTSVQLSWPKKWNGAIDNAVGIVWPPMPITMASHGLENHVAPHFNCFWPNKCSGVIDNDICIMWCQWH